MGTSPARLALFTAAFAAVAFAIYDVLPVHTHWHEIFRPAALALLRGVSPYQIASNFFNPPWALIPLLPFAVLPEAIGNALIGAATLSVFGLVAWKLGARALVLILFLTQPLTLYNVVQVNVEWLVALGLLLPPRLGIFFVLVKPQLGGLVALCWMIQAWQVGRWRAVVQLVWPVVLAFALSFAIFGNYLQPALIVFHDPKFSFWPSSIAFGLATLVLAIRLGRPALGLTAAVLLSPYVEPYSVPLAVLGLVSEQALAAVWLIGSWFMFLDPTRSYVIERLLERWLPSS